MGIITFKKSEYKRFIIKKFDLGIFTYIYRFLCCCCRHAPKKELSIDQNELHLELIPHPENCNFEVLGFSKCRRYTQNFFLSFFCIVISLPVILILVFLKLVINKKLLTPEEAFIVPWSPLLVVIFTTFFSQLISTLLIKNLLVFNKSLTIKFICMINIIFSFFTYFFYFAVIVAGLFEIEQVDSEFEVYD